MNTEPNVIIPREGTLRSGYFFEIAVVETTRKIQLETFGEDCVVAEPAFTDSELWERGELYIQADVKRVEKTVQFRRCSADPEHVTEEYWFNTTVILGAGPIITPILELVLDDRRSFLINESIADALRATSFRGYGIAPVHLTWDNSATRDQAEAYKNLRLFDLHFLGRRCMRSLHVVGRPNACPSCGHDPLFCYGCAQGGTCRACRKVGYISASHRKGAHANLLISGGTAQWRPWILERRNWDGSDFIFGTMDAGPGSFSHVVTARVVNWLLSTHVHSFVARPVLTNTEGMTPQQLQNLEDVCMTLAE